jgi:hypothetical protein
VKERWHEENNARPSEGLERRWMLFHAVGESLSIIYDLVRADLGWDIRKLADQGWNARRDSDHP